MASLSTDGQSGGALPAQDDDWVAPMTGPLCPSPSTSLKALPPTNTRQLSKHKPLLQHAVGGILDSPLIYLPPSLTPISPPPTTSTSSIALPPLAGTLPDHGADAARMLSLSPPQTIISTSAAVPVSKLDENGHDPLLSPLSPEWVSKSISTDVITVPSLPTSSRTSVLLSEGGVFPGPSDGEAMVDHEDGEELDRSDNDSMPEELSALPGPLENKEFASEPDHTGFDVDSLSPLFSISRPRLPLLNIPDAPRNSWDPPPINPAPQPQQPVYHQALLTGPNLPPNWYATPLSPLADLSAHTLLDKHPPALDVAASPSFGLRPLSPLSDELFSPLPDLPGSPIFGSNGRGRGRRSVSSISSEEDEDNYPLRHLLDSPPVDTPDLISSRELDQMSDSSWEWGSEYSSDMASSLLGSPAIGMVGLPSLDDEFDDYSTDLSYPRFPSRSSSLSSDSEFDSGEALAHCIPTTPSYSDPPTLVDEPPIHLFSCDDDAESSGSPSNSLLLDIDIQDIPPPRSPSPDELDIDMMFLPPGVSCPEKDVLDRLVGLRNRSKVREKRARSLEKRLNSLGDCNDSLEKDVDFATAPEETDTPAQSPEFGMALPTTKVERFRMRDESKRRRKRERERCKEIEALLKLKLENFSSASVERERSDASTGLLTPPSSPAVEDVLLSPPQTLCSIVNMSPKASCSKPKLRSEAQATSPGGLSRNLPGSRITSMAQLVARMMFRRRDVSKPVKIRDLHLSNEDTAAQMALPSYFKSRVSIPSPLAVAAGEQSESEGENGCSGEQAVEEENDDDDDLGLNLNSFGSEDGSEDGVMM